MSIVRWLRTLSPAPRVSNVSKYVYADADKSKCVYCLGHASAFDHVLPVSVAELLPYFNFPSELLKLVPCCMRCNSIAGNRFFISFAAKRSFVCARLEELRLRAEYEAALSKLEMILRKY